MTKEDLIEKELRIIDEEIEQYKWAAEMLERTKEPLANKIRNMSPEEFKKEKKAFIKDCLERHRRV